MNSSVKSALITGTCTLIVGVMSGFWASSVHNQNVTVNINGETVSVSQEEYQDMYNELKKEYDELEIENTDLKNRIETQSNKTSSKLKNTNSTKYLVQVLEPFNKNGFKKIIDESMTMGGKTYNNGFELSCNGYAVFNLDTQFSQISGIIGNEDKDITSNTTISFIGDDKVLSTIVIKEKSLPEEFSIDITGVHKLEIKQEDNYFAVIDFAEVIVQ